MTHKTRKSNLQLVALVNNPEILASREVLAPPATVESERPAGRNENKMHRGKLMKRLLTKAPDRLDTSQDSVTMQSWVSTPELEGPRNRSERCKWTEDALNQLTNTLDA